MTLDEFASRADLIKGRMYRTAYLYMGDEASALDAVSESIYKGMKSLRKLRQPEHMETWLTRILINECKKELRRGKRERPVDALPETATEEFDALPLKVAISLLPPDLREVVILRFFNDFTQAQTAECLGIPQGTVVTRQRRALALLRLELSDDEKEGLIHES